MVREAPRVLFVTPELAPWAKVGGLGDVSYDLPRVLAAGGLDIRILVPAYPALVEAFPDAACVAEFPAPGGALAAARLLQARAPVPIYLLDCPAYFARPGIYQSPDAVDWADNHLRYGLLSRIAAVLGSAGSPLAWRPHVIHCNDWPSGLTAAYLAYTEGSSAATVLTVHNLAYQGIFPPHVLDELGLPGAAFTIDGLEFYGNVSFLKAGLSYANKLTTVSPTYATEIQSPEFGCGLDELLRRRAADLTGIANGIDCKAWDPARDPHLARNYDREHLEHKRENKTALQRALGLPEAPDVPVFGMVSRLVWQKGVDLMIEAAASIVRSPAQIVVHGEGERNIAAELRTLAARHPRDIAVRVGFEDRIAHQIVAGADAFLIPSRFEPCGLTQLQSMRYGTLPVAQRTGGLADSVVDATEENVSAGTATGFTFDGQQPHAVLDGVERAVGAYRTPAVWRALQRNGMARNHDWVSAVRAYINVYRGANRHEWPRPVTERGKAIVAKLPRPADRALIVGAGVGRRRIPA
jgi:starch synthase